MCSGSKREPTQTGFAMGNEYQKQDDNASILLELAASNNLIGFRKAIEEDGLDVDKPGLWYGRRMGLKGMGFEERTPLMVASLFGSKDVVKYILGTGLVDVNKNFGPDGVTALHCAAAGGSSFTLEVVKLLLDASADPNPVDANGNHPSDVIPILCNSNLNYRRKALEIVLKGGSSSDEACFLPDRIEMEAQEQLEISTPRSSKEGPEKKEYPVDLTLPDIKNGIYGTDEFRMYTFKIKPCSRAYSHDWTECPFVHPGENARRRDPRKYHYSCVPCPDFRKGSCRHGDACEYAHGIFECWLHPAQYRTRLCKDETNCSRRVCFFAHKLEELRPLYTSTGSALPSPRSYLANGSNLDIGSLSALALGSPSVLVPSVSTPSITSSGPSSPIAGWSNQSNIVSSTLQLSGSRLKSALNARDMDLDMDFLERESLQCWQQRLLDEVSGLASPSSWSNGFSTAAFINSFIEQTGELNGFGGGKPTNLEDIFGSADLTILPQLQGLSLDVLTSQLHSPKRIPTSQNIDQQLRSSYSTTFSSSPVRMLPSFGLDPSAAAFSSKSAAFANQRSQSFIERSAVSHRTGLSSPVSSAATFSSSVTDWGSPGGKLDWGIQEEELNKLRKAASFGIRSNGSSFAGAGVPVPADVEPDVSWVHSLVKDNSPIITVPLGFEDDRQQQQQQCYRNTTGMDNLPAWVEQMYSEQEQLVA